MEKNPKEIVLNFLSALNNDDFNAAKTFLANDMKFDGVLGKRDGADDYINDMRKMRFKYHVIKVFADGNDVCVLYDIDMNKGRKIFTCGWYTISDGKIKSLKVVFDPRPVIK